MSAVLTEKEQAFAAGVASGKSGTQAAKDAGYSERSAAPMAARLIRKVKVADEIARLRSVVVARIEERTGLTLDRLIEESSFPALLDPAELYDDKGILLPIAQMPPHVRRAIQSIEVEQKFIPGPGGDDEALIEVRVHKVKFWDKPKAIELTARLRGDLKSGENAAVTNNTFNLTVAQVGQLTDDELAQVRGALKAATTVLEARALPAGKKGGRV